MINTQNYLPCVSSFLSSTNHSYPDKLLFCHISDTPVMSCFTSFTSNVLLHCISVFSLYMSSLVLTQTIFHCLCSSQNSRSALSPLFYVVLLSFLVGLLPFFPSSALSDPNSWKFFTSIIFLLFSAVPWFWVSFGPILFLGLVSPQYIPSLHIL